jgi:hypothetical protein
MSMSFTAFERSFDLVKFGDHFNLRRRTEFIVMLADKGIVLGALSVTVLRESPPTHAPSLNRHRLGQIPRLIDIRSPCERRVERQQLHWNSVQDRR